MKIAKVGVIDMYGGYRCRFCDTKVAPDLKTCPVCGIPWPPEEKIAMRFLLWTGGWMLGIGLAGWFLGWLAGFLIPSVLTQAAGAVAGLVAGFFAGRYRSAREEVRMRTFALLRTRPEALGWRASEVAAAVGTPALGVVEGALARARKEPRAG